MEKRTQFAIMATGILLASGFSLASAVQYRKPLQEKYIAEAQDILRNGETGKSWAKLQKAKALGPNPQATLIEARILILEKRHKKAITALKGREDEVALGMLGESLYAIHEYDKALASLSKIPEQRRTSKDWETMVKSSLQKGETLEAASLTENALRHLPENQILLHYKKILVADESRTNERTNRYLRGAAWLFENGFYGSAEKYVEKAIAIKPRYRDAYLLRAEIQTAEGNEKDAQWSLEQAREIDPYYYLTYLKLADLFQRQGEMGKASEAADTAKNLYF